MEWVTVSESEYWDMLGCLPPEDRSEIGFLVGEITRHNLRGVPLFQAYARVSDRFVKSLYPMSVERFKGLKVGEILC